MNEPKPDRTEVGLILLLSLFGCAWSATVLLGLVTQLSDALHQYRARSFPTTVGRVIYSSVERRVLGNKKPTTFYWPEIEYEYTVNGETYRASRVRYERDSSDSDPAPARSLVSSHPVDSEVTVFYDPHRPAEALLEPGVTGRDLFLFPVLAFTAVSLLALRFLGGWWFASFIRPEAGGVRIICEGSRTRVRLPRYSPLMLGLAAMLILSLAGLFLTDGGSWKSPPLRNVELGLAAVAVGSVGVFALFWRRLVSGVDDLVIDSDVDALTLPRSFGRKEQLTLPLSTVLSVELREVGEGKRYTCYPTLHFRDPAQPEATLAKWNDRRKGRAFVAWLRDRL